MVDLLYSAHNRRAFTAASLATLMANTNWSLVRCLWLYDDSSTDGAGDLVGRFRPEGVLTQTILGSFGGVVPIMLDFLRESDCELFAKIDNDVMAPPGWLDACVDVMQAAPELDLLGIEPPLSRTPAPWANGKRIAAPENDAPKGARYARCEAIGGIGMMRRDAFDTRRPMQAHGPYGGFTTWQTSNPSVIKGWIMPPLPVCLLDRMPTEPWASLSRQYIDRGWQRAWTNYTEAESSLWEWWATTQQEPASL